MTHRQKFDLIYKAEDLLWVTQPIPLVLKIGRAKPKKADLNSFTNLGHRKSQNSVKQAYAKYLKNVLPEPPLEPYLDRVKFLFTYMAPDRRIRDLGNMCAMVDKFTSDVVVDLGFIVDDSTKYIHNIHFAYAGIDENKFSHARLYIFKDYDI